MDVRYVDVVLVLKCRTGRAVAAVIGAHRPVLEDGLSTPTTVVMSVAIEGIMHAIVTDIEGVEDIGIV